MIDCIGDNKEVVGYVNGVPYSGPYHVMSNGLKMTGATHSETDSIIYDTIEESLGGKVIPSQVTNVGVTTSTVLETEVETTSTSVTTPTSTMNTTSTTSTTTTDTSSGTSTPSAPSTPSTPTPPSTPDDGGGYGGY